jgi:DNA-binding CsgD family transcriptional regulator
MTTTTLTARRASAALDLLAQLSAPIDRARFGALLMQHTGNLFTADRVSIADVSGTGTATGLSWPAEIPPPIAEVFFRRGEEHPAIAALREHADIPFRLREHWTVHRLRCLPIYQEFMRPMGCRDQLSITLATDGTRLAALGLIRVGGEFDENDRQLLRRLAGPLRLLYQVAQRRNPVPSPLTSREEQILRLVSDGHTDRVIGRRLGVSQRTVEKHLEAVRVKLGVTNRAAAVARWLGTAGDR